MPEIAKNHHAIVAWDWVALRIRDEVEQRNVHPADTVVLLPYAQLMQHARAAWQRATGGAAGFVPRFETTLNWSRSLGGFSPDTDDLRLDAATDALTAASLMRRAGMGRAQPALAGKLMEAAWSLARVAAAVAPPQRAAWGAQMAASLGVPEPDSPLRLETWLGRIAVAWVAGSAYETDVLFSARAELLVLVEGFQSEPLLDALRARYGNRCVCLTLDRPAARGALALHAAADAEDEAERAAACVLQHLAQGRCPVALIAQDRFLVRRVRAMLAERGVLVRDETGWTLSTTRAAATLMGSLRAMAWDASGDTVLDWLKNAPAFDPAQVAALETQMRRIAARSWQQVGLQTELAQRVAALRASMQAARSTSAWLQALRDMLHQTGQWAGLLGDTAGQSVITATHLQVPDADVFEAHQEAVGQSVFVAWLTQVLEAGSFVPPHPAQEHLVILPLTQLLGRAPAAVVFPGTDEDRFPACAEPAGWWTAAQRIVLGLPSRAQLVAANRVAWSSALRAPHIDFLWRVSDNGEPVMASALVQELLLPQPGLAAEPRRGRQLQARAIYMPRPSGAELPVTTMSASAYEDLRSCPYRFFALRQLGLRERDELDQALGKRDFGVWLHAVLRHFHEALQESPVADARRRRAAIDAAAERATREQRLDAAEFLPFSATWPRVREAYLQWLTAHEISGSRFVEAEAEHQIALGRLRVQGRIDRIDQSAQGHKLVIDYKTEQRTRTAQRVKAGSEDVQLPFYAALLADDTVDAMYLSIGETGPAKVYAQPDIVALRDELVQAVLSDTRRIAQGAPLPAMGTGAACEFCAARGLCRKDHWGAAETLDAELPLG